MSYYNQHHHKDIIDEKKPEYTDPENMTEETASGEDPIKETPVESSKTEGENWVEDFNNFNSGNGLVTPEQDLNNASVNNNTVDTQIADLMNQISNRKQFNYDINGDALYQQYADIYENQARLGMENAMAQAAALTGGYDSSYSQAVGQQAYAQQMQDLNAVGMDLYDRAYSQYQDDRQELYNQLSTLYGIKQDEEATNQWHALNGNFKYDETGNIIGLEGGYYQEQQQKELEVANPYTTYQGEGAYNGKDIPKQIAGVQNLTTDNVGLFDENGVFIEPSLIDVDYVRGGEVDPTTGKKGDKEDVFNYNYNGKTISVRRGYSPITNTKNPDADKGTFENGYQPDNINGVRLIETLEDYIMNGKSTPIYSTKDGKEFVYDAANNVYIELIE